MGISKSKPYVGATWLCVASLLVCGCGSSFDSVSNSPAGAYETSLAVFDDGGSVSWYDTRDGHPEIYARALDAEGHPAGAELRLTTSANAAYEPDVVPLRSGVAIGWYDKTGDGPDAQVTPRLGVWARDGKLRWVKTLAPSGRNTVVRASGGAIFAAWIQDEGDFRSGLWAAWWRDDGVELLTPRRIADAGKTTWNLNAAMDPGASPGRPRAWVVFDARVETMAEELFIADIGEADVHVTRLTADDGKASKYPDVAFSENRVAITWFDVKDGNEEVYLFVGSRQTIGDRKDLQGQRVTTTSGHSIGAYLSWNHDRLGLAWCDDSLGQHEIYFQSFDAAGKSEGAATRVTDTPASSLIPAIKPWKSGFILAWNEFEPPPEGVHGVDGRSQVMVKTLP